MKIKITQTTDLLVNSYASDDDRICAWVDEVCEMLKHAIRKQHNNFIQERLELEITATLKDRPQGGE